MKYLHEPFEPSDQNGAPSEFIAPVLLAVGAAVAVEVVKCIFEYEDGSTYCAQCYQATYCAQCYGVAYCASGYGGTKGCS